MRRSTFIRTAAVGTACALAGGAAGIAESSASSTTQRSHGQAPRAAICARKLTSGAFAGPGFAIPLAKRFAGPMMLAGGPAFAVHAEEVVANEKGGFETVTMDSGTFSSLSGNRLTINEGTRHATYKTVELTIPSNATVFRNGEKASLSDIAHGDTVTVEQSSAGTVVSAADERHEPKFKAAWRVTRGASSKQGSGEAAGPAPGSGPALPACGAAFRGPMQPAAPDLRGRQRP